MKKKTRRDKEKYKALYPKLNLKSRQEELEVDYLDKLSEDEKEWLNKFNDEYVNAHLDRKKLKKNLHRTKKLKSEIDNRNYTRKKDVYTGEKASGRLKFLNDMKVELTDCQNYEDILIYDVDMKLKK